MSKRRLLFTVLATGVLVLGLAGPAYARQVVPNNCWVVDEGLQELRGNIYVESTPDGRFHYINQITYRLHNGTSLGTQSNFNVRVYSPNDSLVWSYNSPDDRHSDDFYVLSVPNVGVVDGYKVKFIAIFDITLAPDSRCSHTVVLHPGGLG